MPSQVSGNAPSTLGQKIRAAREAKDLSQFQLALLIQRDPQQVSKWERDVNRPSDENLAALCVALGQDGSWMTEPLPEREAA